MTRLNWYCFVETFLSTEGANVRKNYCKIRDAIRGSHGYPRMMRLDLKRLNILFDKYKVYWKEVKE